MRKFVSTALIGLLCFGVSFGGPFKKVPKNEIKMHRFEPAPSEHSPLGHGSSKIVMPNRNSGNYTLVDSSTNGFGMVVTATRPLFNDPENTGYFFASYRQYCGEGTTHGQLGGAFSEDAEDWITYYNLNSNGSPPWGGGGVGGSGVSQARYPSAVGTEDFPVAIWGEYTGDTSTGSTYGGRPYYTLDEFDWDGGSFIYPLDVDLLWASDSKDLWVASAAASYDDDLGSPVINTAWSDWTRSENYVFQSEIVDGTDIIFGEEKVVISEQLDLVPGDGGSSFNTNSMMSCTPEGLCGLGLVGLWAGGDNDASSISNNHTGIFRMSEDHGMSWHGCSGAAGCAPSNVDGDGYYYIYDEVWDDLIATQFDASYVDECEGTDTPIDDFWTYYNDDFKLDREGNPHFVIQVLPCGGEFCYYTATSGLYHFTIDRDHLDNPGPVNTDTGWNWSFVMSGELTYEWASMTGDSYIWDSHASLAFSVEDPDILYIVTNMATEGAFGGDPANLEDPCYFSTWADYPEWSEDIYVVKSEDGGQTWWNPLNTTGTPDESDGICPNGYPKCDPAEQYPHAAQWATDTDVYIMYQMPNWEFNEIGDLSGADFMNRVYMGYATVDDDDIPPYGPGDSCYAEVGDITGDGIINVLDIISLVNHVLGMSMLDDVCAADFSGDGIVNILDIVGMVNYILGGLASDGDDVEPAATEVIIHSDSNLHLEYNSGNVQAVELTLSSKEALVITWADDLYYALNTEYNQKTGETMLIVISNGFELKDIATISNADYIVKDAVVVSYDIETEAPVMLKKDHIGIDQTPLANDDDVLPNGYRISNAYPNPFNPVTSFKVDLDNESFVSIQAYNILGQLTAEVFSGNLNGYANQIIWDASSVSSGVYFIKIQVDNHLESQKVYLVK